jgi:hypothetical protein
MYRLIYSEFIIFNFKRKFILIFSNEKNWISFRKFKKLGSYLFKLKVKYILFIQEKLIRR